MSVIGREDRGTWYCGVLRVNVGLGFQNWAILLHTPQSLALTTPSWILKQIPLSFKLLKITYFGKFRKVSLLPALSSMYHLKRTFAAVGLSSLFLVTGYSAGGCGCEGRQRGRGRVSVHAKCACGHQRTISSVSPLHKHLVWGRVFFVFHCVCQARWPINFQKFSCLCFVRALGLWTLSLQCLVFHEFWGVKHVYIAKTFYHLTISLAHHWIHFYSWISCYT